MGNDRAYKRRWRNLLLNARYQLSFTTLLVGITAILMVALGWWVKDKAYVATGIAANSVIELQCPEMPELVERALHPMPAMNEGDDGDSDDDDSENDQIPDEPPASPTAGDDADKPKGDDGGDEAGGDEAGGDEAGGDEAGDGERRPRVILEESSIEAVVPTINPATMTAATLDNLQCRIAQSYKIQPLWSRYRLILYVLFGTTVFLVIGLAFYGIKMTHKVAGPLYKVGLYLDKLAAGRYDTVWNLRKGDQLMEFYKHFKGAHAGLTEMLAADLEVLEAVREALDSVDEPSPELAAAIGELDELLAAKRESYQVGGDS